MSSGMIVAPQPLAVEEGAKVLAAGGNAIDAAVTCAFVQTVVSPQMCGIGGYAVLTMSLAPGHPPSPEERLISLDAPALAGSRVRADMWQDIALRPNPSGWGYFVEGCVNDQGYQSICTPGTVRALALMLERWGTISWRDAIGPAQALAREGFVVDAHLAAGWKARPAYPEACSLLDRIHANPAACDIYLHEDGASYEAGEILRNPDYAGTLAQLAECGAEDFYAGALAENMIRDLAENGSFVTAEDLASYRLRETEAVMGTYRGYTIYSAPAPHGGPTLVELLNILEGYDLAAMIHNSPEYIYLLAMAMKGLSLIETLTWAIPRLWICL